MILTDEQLRELTRRTRTDAQRRALDAMGIKYKVRHDGTLAVSSAHVEHELGSAATITVREPQLHL